MRSESAGTRPAGCEENVGETDAVGDRGIDVRHFYHRMTAGVGKAAGKPDKMPDILF
jgi:hypothetical protein